ncbi:ribosome biogenesis protein WDR12 homolog isoform X1 [Nymphaea colorata]|nr:ribosome biogenesis protein WDR12 homolog isoform X1 [Nymphaea colorata]
MEGSTSREAKVSRQIRVRFITSLPKHLRVPSSSMAVPSDVNRFVLSDIINALLPQDTPIAFDFLIGGQLVRTPLDKFLLENGISAEKVLDIEYTYAAAPQKQEDPCVHDDWVSALDGSHPSLILSGCYDGNGRVWRHGATCTHILEGHTGAIASVSIVDAKANDHNGKFCVATASKDRTLRLWKFNAGDLVECPKKVSAFKILRGHTSSVQSVSSDPSGQMVCSGSWDCSVKLWHANESDAEGGLVSIKKRKVNSVADLNETSQMEADAVSTFTGHTQCVSSVVWPEQETIYSASWDYSVRIWDVETGNNSMTLVCKKVLHCLDVGGESSALIAAGGSDPVLRIWDPRRPGSLAPVFEFSSKYSHKSWITSCKWHAKSWFHLLSSSYDGKVILWDVRTQLPITILEAHEDKVLCTDWWGGDSVISGGADSKLCIFSGCHIS